MPDTPPATKVPAKKTLKLTIKKKKGDTGTPDAATKVPAPLNGLQNAQFIVGSPGRDRVIIANQRYFTEEPQQESPPMTAKSNIILAQKGDGPMRGN